LIDASDPSATCPASKRGHAPLTNESSIIVETVL
jgi:hypothetical protein